MKVDESGRVWQLVHCDAEVTGWPDGGLDLSPFTVQHVTDAAFAQGGDALSLADARLAIKINLQKFAPW